MKKSAKKDTSKKAKKKAGPRLFPTKAELEAMKLAREAGARDKGGKNKKAGPRLFPTKAELEAMKAAASGTKPVTAASTAQATGK
ncbi:MAG: hypothetical protein ACK55I_26560, partial [bacterium]